MIIKLIIYIYIYLLRYSNIKDINLEIYREFTRYKQIPTAGIMCNYVNEIYFILSNIIYIIYWGESDQVTAVVVHSIFILRINMYLLKMKIKYILMYIDIYRYKLKRDINLNNSILYIFGLESKI